MTRTQAQKMIVKIGQLFRDKSKGALVKLEEVKELLNNANLQWEPEPEEAPPSETSPTSEPTREAAVTLANFME